MPRQLKARDNSSDDAIRASFGIDILSIKSGLMVKLIKEVVFNITLAVAETWCVESNKKLPELK